MKINILGWYGKKNAGDEAFKYVFNELFEGHEINYVCPPNNLTKADITILGGGNVVSPFYLRKIVNEEVHAIGVGIGYESEINLMESYKFKSVYVRNMADVDKIKEKVCSKAQYIPDLAFCLKPELGKREKKITVLLTDYVNPAIDRPLDIFATRACNFILKISKELDSIADMGYEIEFLPCSTGGYGDDRRIAFDVLAFMKNRGLNILDTMEPLQIINHLSKSTLNICMRFHAHVFSILAETPFISIPFSRKVELFLKENELEELECMRVDGFNKLLEVFNKTLTNSDDYINKFKKIKENNLIILEDFKKKVLQDLFVKSA